MSLYYYCWHVQCGLFWYSFFACAHDILGVLANIFWHHLWRLAYHDGYTCDHLLNGWMNAKGVDKIENWRVLSMNEAKKEKEHVELRRDDDWDLRWDRFMNWWDVEKAFEFFYRSRLLVSFLNCFFVEHSYASWARARGAMTCEKLSYGSMLLMTWRVWIPYATYQLSWLLTVREKGLAGYVWL